MHNAAKSEIEDYLTLDGPILDVRSPAEFLEGHLPGAVSFPLFSNAERAEIGTCYKRLGQDQAILLGLKILGPTLDRMGKSLYALKSGGKPLRFYCWRGGMRSGCVAWLAGLFGIEAITLKGGYKSFRRWVQQQFQQSYELRVVIGKTGVGKTEFLHKKRIKGEQVIDLEKLANHKGSVFGAEETPQPSQTHFENMLAITLQKLDPNVPTWIEGESRLIGNCIIPETLFNQMRSASALELIATQEQRYHRLLGIYRDVPPERLISATCAIAKRLGSQRAAIAIQFIRQGRLDLALEQILYYYDRTYDHSHQKLYPDVKQMKLDPILS
jgi:tRNA 2-selenouridine synthase